MRWRDWCKQTIRFSVLRNRQRSWSVVRKLFYHVSAQTSYRFRCSGWHFPPLGRFCWLVLLHHYIPLTAHFNEAFFPFVSWDSHKKGYVRSVRPYHGSVSWFPRTCSPHWSALNCLNNTFNGWFWGGETGFLHPIGGHWPSNLYVGGADGSVILGRVVVYNDLLDLDEVAREALAVDAATDVTGASVVSAAASDDDQVEDGALELEVWSRTTYLCVLRIREWSTAPTFCTLLLCRTLKGAHGCTERFRICRGTSTNLSRCCLWVVFLLVWGWIGVVSWWPCCERGCWWGRRCRSSNSFPFCTRLVVCDTLFRFIGCRRNAGRRVVLFLWLWFRIFCGLG